MLRLLSNPLIEISGRIFGANPQCLQFYRWRRKPRWLPTAKSKVFRIPEKPIQSPEEKKELFRLYNQYRLQMRAVIHFFREEVKRIKETSTADHLVITPEEENAEFQRCLDENAAWNAKIAQEREERLLKQRVEQRAHIAERLKLAEEREREKLERIEEIVRKEKERAKSYITRETIDSAIEHALANPVDFNFALDLQGNMYAGRTAKKPSETPESTEKALSVG